MENIYENMRKEREEKTRALCAKRSHPLYVFHEENMAVKKAVMEGQLDKAFRENLSIHYAKKGDLLYPLLKSVYGVAGPSDMMWTEDDEIKADLRLQKEGVAEHILKMCLLEEKVLFTNCAGNFTEEEWMGVYQDMGDYAICFGVTADPWPEAEKMTAPLTEEKEIVLPGGTFNSAELRALLNTIPMEITFVDADDRNRFFNEGPKDFKRPKAALNRSVFSCHPPKVAEKVKRIIEEFRNGTLDELPIWMERNGKCVLVKYMAVRDSAGSYLGTMEIVQNMGFAKEHFEKKDVYHGED